MTTVHTLASGSSGNALLLSCGESYILLDAGISCRRITAALRELGLELGSLTAILITHTHADHISGLQTLLKRCAAPVFTTERAARELSWRLPGAETRLDALDFGIPQSIGEFAVTAFPTSHDAPGSCGFRLDAAGGVQPETTGTGSVMGCGKCRHGKLSDRLGDAEVQRVQPCLCAGQPPGQLPGGPLGGKNRGGAALEQRLQTGDVVRVGVRDENGREASELQAQLPQSGSDAAAGNARIQQNIALPAGEQQRVPGGTACQRMYGGQKTYLFR